jgi:cysteine desulfurase/selenocysteine lyase
MAASRVTDDVGRVRLDFPILQPCADGRPLVYLDSAATTQKPRVVLDRIARFYAGENANVRRGVHRLAAQSTERYEQARGTVQRFLNAADAGEIVFVRGTTEAVNLVAQTYGRTHVGPEDEVVVTQMEHHSNLLPWQRLCDERGARLRVIPVTDAGELCMDALPQLLNERTRLVAVTHVSNVFGTVNPVAGIVRMAHARGIPVLVDGAQAVAHLPVDVQALGCDFYAFSGHKVFGPTGIGALYARMPVLETMPPYQSGGGMVTAVARDHTEYAAVPHRFEAGTPHIEGAVGLAAALEYVETLGFDWVRSHERDLLAYVLDALSGVSGVRVLGAPSERISLVTFVVDGVHAHDVAEVLDQAGIAVRAGHHCCQPLMARLGVPATVRVSCSVYTTRSDVDALVAALGDVRTIFG